MQSTNCVKWKNDLIIMLSVIGSSPKPGQQIYLGHVSDIKVFKWKKDLHDKNILS